MSLPESKFIVWRKDDYPFGTVGRKVFPPLIDQRRRLSAPLHNPSIKYLVGFKNQPVLAQEGIERIGNLIDADENMLKGLLRNRGDYLTKTYEEIGKLLSRYILSPDDRFMQRVFREFTPESVLIEPDREDRRREVIGEVLLELGQAAVDGHQGRALEVVNLRFGFENWNPMKLDDIAKKMQLIPTSRVRDIEGSVWSWMRTTHNRERLRFYLPHR